MTIRPLHDRILVKRIDEDSTAHNGIYIPEIAKERPVTAQVIAVGNGKVRDDGSVVTLQVKPGDKILFAKYAGSVVKIDGEEHLIMREDDILAVME